MIKEPDDQWPPPMKPVIALWVMVAVIMIFLAIAVAVSR